MPKRHTFIVSDENVINSYGFRVMTGGIRLTQYRKNSIVLWMHKRPSRWDGNDKDKERFPIGTAHNLRRKDGQLLADIEFDQNDEFAKTIEQKVESGIVKMASAGLMRVSSSTDSKHLLPGQTRATLTVSELIEISIVDIGSNPNALKLYNENTEVVELSAEGCGDFIPLLNSNQNHKKVNEFQKQVAVLLGLNAEAAEDNVMETLRTQLSAASKYVELKGKYDNLVTAHETLKHAEVTKLVNSMVDKKIKAEQKETYLTIGKESGLETLQSVFDSLVPIDGRPTDQLGRQTQRVPGAGGEVKYDSFEALAKRPQEEIAAYKESNPEEYTQLYNDWMAAE